MKKKVEVKHLIEDINAKLPDEAIMSKYDLSKDGLKKVFDKLMRTLAAGSRGGTIEVDD